MNSDAQPSGHDLEDFRAFLVYLARLHLDPRLQGKLDAEDIVQDTLFDAHEKRDQFRGEPRQRKAWLRRILLNKLANAVQKFRSLKCDANREQSLDAALEKSSLRLKALLAAEDTPPEQKAQRNEEALRLDEVLADLPERQRQVVMLKHYHGWTLAEISTHLSLTQPAVVGLLHRGLTKLRDELIKPE